METKTIETSLSLKQLGTEIREAYAEVKRNLSRYRKTKGAKKLPHLTEMQKYIIKAQAAFKKLEAKLVRESEGVSLQISDEIAKNPIGNYSKLMPEFDRIDEILASIERGEGIEMRKSYGEMRLARGIRNRILTIKSDTRNKVKNQIAIGRRREEAKTARVIRLDEHRRQKDLRQQHIAQSQQRRAA